MHSSLHAWSQVHCIREIFTPFPICREMMGFVANMPLSEGLAGAMGWTASCFFFFPTHLLLFY